MTRAGVATLLALLVVLAGCSALPGRDDGPPGTTLAGGEGGADAAGDGGYPDARPGPASDDLDVEVVPVDEDLPVAPGLTQAAVTDAGVLADAHRSVLRNTSYTLSLDRHTRWSNGTTARRQVDAAFGGDGRFRWVVRGNAVGTNPAVRDRTWVNGTHRHRVVPRADGTERYEVVAGSPATFESAGALGESPTQAASVGDLLGAFEVTNVTARRTMGGMRYIVQSETVQRPSALASGDVHSASLYARIDSVGVVRRLHVEYDVRRDGGLVHREYSLRVSRVGTTRVERPAWVDNATHGTDG